MSNFQALTCRPNEQFHSTSLQVFYAFKADQIDKILSDETTVNQNPLEIPGPHEFSIIHGESVLPLGTQVRFVRLDSTSKLPLHSFLTSWSQNLGITEMYKIDNQLFLLLDLPTLLLHQTGTRP